MKSNVLDKTRSQINPELQSQWIIVEEDCSLKPTLKLKSVFLLLLLGSGFHYNCFMIQQCRLFTFLYLYASQLLSVFLKISNIFVRSIFCKVVLTAAVRGEGCQVWRLWGDL